MINFSFSLFSFFFHKQFSHNLYYLFYSLFFVNYFPSHIFHHNYFPISHFPFFFHSLKKHRFLTGDFGSLATPIAQNEEQPATVYSRFTLHAVNRTNSSHALNWAFQNLSRGGVLLIEVRSVKDKLYGQGTPVSEDKDAFVTSHYRRFVRKDELEAELKGLGFTIEHSIEQDNLAVYKDDNPVVIRIHARKKEQRK